MDIVHYTGISALSPLLHITSVLESAEGIDVSDEEFIKISDKQFSEEFGISYPTDVYKS